MSSSTTDMDIVGDTTNDNSQSSTESNINDQSPDSSSKISPKKRQKTIIPPAPDSVAQRRERRTAPKSYIDPPTPSEPSSSSSSSSSGSGSESGSGEEDNNNNNSDHDDNNDDDDDNASKSSKSSSSSNNDNNDDDNDSTSKKQKKKRKHSESTKKKSSSSSKTPAKKRVKTTTKKKTTTSKKKTSTTNKKKKPSSSSSKSSPSKKAKTTSTSSDSTPKKQPTRLKLLENSMKAVKWWVKEPLPEGILWNTLEHNGVQFPPPYQPHGVKMKYDGTPIALTPVQEEVATYYAACIGSQQLQKESTAKTFNTNFFNDFKEVLGSNHIIKQFEKCDFTPIREYLDEVREAKKNIPNAEKNANKAKEQEEKLKYMFALVDGALVKVANTLVEPPGLFRGRGEHPKAGKIKPRVMPEDVVLNLGETAPVPACPIPGHSWGGVVHDRSVTWLATWKDMSGNRKYVYLSASSHFKGQADIAKYDKARELKKRIPQIRADYVRNMKSSTEINRQIAVCMWIIDRLSLRVGGEKDEDEADTVGTTSLRKEHVTLEEPLKLKLDFLGKDSMRHLAEYDLSNQEQYEDTGQLVFDCLKSFLKGKQPEDSIFNLVDPTILNEHLKTLMPGLSAKVFRTYNASVTLERKLPFTVPEDTTIEEKESIFNEANRAVAIICNHQRTVSKAAETGLGKKLAEVQLLAEQINELKTMLKRVQGGKKVELKPEISSQGTATTTSSSNANEDDKVNEEIKKYAHLFESQPTEEQVEKRLLKWQEKHDSLKHKFEEAEKNKTIALNTSKINYIDPRICVAWSKRNEFPIEKVYSATIREKFPWAMQVDSKYVF
jgi:DNA topoisomerase-1